MEKTFSYIDKTDFGYIPDILAHKNEDILVGEVKGNEGLREIQTAIGQALSYYSYGGNIIVVIVPENLKLVARSIIKNTCFENGGKIGLYSVNDRGEVKEEIAYKRITLSEKQQERGKEKISNITFIRDLSIQELKRLIEKIYLLKKNYNSGIELYDKLGKKARDYIFKERKPKGSLTEKSFTNALISTNNLGITDSNKLAPLGISIALDLLQQKEKLVNLRLIKILLLKGNFIYILREWENLPSSVEEKDIDKIRKIVKFLKKKNLLKETISSLDDYTRRTKNNQIQWLRDLEVIKSDNKINWVLVCDAINSQVV